MLTIDFSLETLLRVIVLLILVGVWTFFSTKVYVLYKRIVLWVQTYNLRKKFGPLMGVCYYISNRWGKIKYFLLKKEPKRNIRRQPKGLVGVIAVNIQQVSGAVLSENSLELNEIYFADKEGEYDNRNTHLDEKIIREQCDIITAHYKRLTQVIVNEYKDNPLFFYEEEKHGKITSTSVPQKCLSLYSYDNIVKYIKKVNDEMHNNNAIHFIGDKLGVKDFSFEKKCMQLDIYKTDHFTWQVFKEIFKAHKPFFQEIMLRVNSANVQEKKILVRCLAFVFSSFGIDIVIESKDCKGKRKLIITARSGGIETNKKSSLHVSVNETFSRTDSVGDSTIKYSLHECVRRGIQEEIGIPEEEIKDDMIRFHDFAIVTDEGEIGLSCHVDLTRYFPIERILMYPGQDKFLENEELIVLPYFKALHLDLIKSIYSPSFMRQFYSSTLNDRFNMPWMSFTPLLISRVMIRNIKFNWLGQLLWLAFYWGICVLLSIHFICPTYTAVLWEQILGGTCQIIALLWLNCNGMKHKYKFIQPFVSQWHGNAKVIQANGYTEGQMINEGVTIGIDNSIKNERIKISDFNLEYPPYCAVRIKKEKNNFAEKPISFFQLKRKSSHDVDNCQLKFYFLHFVVGQLQSMINMRFYYEKDKFSEIRKIKKISFGSEIDVCINECKDIVSSFHDIHVFKSFLRMKYEHVSKLETNLNIQLPPQFTEDYYLSDLFSYQNDYYWSCIVHKRKLEDCNIVFNLASLDSPLPSINGTFYQNIERLIKEKKEDNGYLDITLRGNNNFVELMLASFISYYDNKIRISELELYMMQLYLIRKGILLADCVHKNPEEYKICFAKQ